MLLKAPDDETAELVDLEQFATVASPARRRQIPEERRILRAGIKEEHESAGLLDFHFKASRNTAIIHDLRLKVNDRVAQIDQLLLHRTLNVSALETKHFTAGVKSTEEGKFLRWNPSAKTYEGMPSPLAQNERHIAVLKDAFERIDIPTRLGLRLTPVFLSYVLVSPRARIERPERFDTSHVLKADMFPAEDEMNRRGLLKGIGHISRFVSSSTLPGLGDSLSRSTGPPQSIMRRASAPHRPDGLGQHTRRLALRLVAPPLCRHHGRPSEGKGARPASTAGAISSRFSRVVSAFNSRVRRVISTRLSKSHAGSPGTASGSARTAAPYTAHAPPAARAPCSS